MRKVKNLGSFKVFDPHHNLKYIKRSKKATAELREEIIEYVRLHPRSTVEDVMIAFDLSKDMSYYHLSWLRRNDKIYKVALTPDRYRAYEPVTVTRPAQIIKGVDQPHMHVVAPRQAVDNTLITVKRYKSFEDRVNSLFMEYIDRKDLLADELLAVNEFRKFITSKNEENN